MAKSISNLFLLYCDGVSSLSLSVSPSAHSLCQCLSTCHQSTHLFHFPLFLFPPLPLLSTHTTMYIPISCHWASIASLDCVKCLSCLFASVKCFIRLSYIHTHTHVYRGHTYTYILATLAPTQVPPLTRLPRLSSAKLSICSILKCGKNFHTKRYSIYQIYIPFIIIVCSMFFYMFPRLMFIAFYDVDRIIFWHILA